MYRRLFSLGGGLVLGTLIVFMAVGVLPCPKIAVADHVAANDCRQYTDAHPVDFNYENNVGVFDPGYRQVCVLKNEQLRELKDVLIFAATGSEPEPGAFVMTRETARQLVQRNVAGTPGLKSALAKQGMTQAASKVTAFFRFLRMPGDETAGALRVPVDGRLSAGAGGATWKDSGGRILGEMLVKKIDAGGKVTFITAGPTATNYTGFVGMEGSDGSSRAYSLRVNTTSPISTIAPCSSCEVRWFVMDMSPTGGVTTRRYISGFMRVGALTPLEVPTHEVTEVGSPTETTAAPPAGDHVLQPHQTRRLYDDLTREPEYVPPRYIPEPPPNVDRDQWQQHKKRERELTPPGGAPVGEPTVNEDGSVTTRFTDGSSVTTWPDRTEVVINRNGDQVWKYPSGPTREYNPGTGEERIIYPDETIVINRPGEAPRWLRPPAPGMPPEPIPTPPAEQYPTPPTGNYSPPPPPEGTAGCPSARKFTFDLPTMNLADVFPFSLILRAVQWFDLLASPPVAPSFNLPFFGRVSVPPAWDGMMGGIRAAVLFICGIGMSFWFYRYVSGRGSE